MPRKSMHDPRYARRVWATFRARRAGTSFRPVRNPGEAPGEAERLKDERAAVFAQPAAGEQGHGPQDGPHNNAHP